MINCVTEKVTFAVDKIISSFFFGTLIWLLNIGNKISTMEIPINAALAMAPTPMPMITLFSSDIVFAATLLWNNAIPIASNAFPIMMQGITAGIPDVIGDGLIKNEVIGAMIDKIIPLPAPTNKIANTIVIFTIVPVMYTDTPFIH